MKHSVQKDFAEQVSLNLRELTMNSDFDRMTQIDEIVPPAVDIAPLEHSAYVPAIKEVTLRPRPVSELRQPDGASGFTLGLQM